MKKRILAVLIAALCLSACGNAGPQKEPETVQEPSVEETIAEPLEAVPPVEESEEETGPVTEEETGEEDSEEAAGTDSEQYEDSESRTAGDYSYHVRTLNKTWRTQDGVDACTVMIEYPVFEEDSAAEEAVNSFYEEWVSDKLAEYEDDPESIVRFALETKSDPEYADFPVCEEDFRTGVIVREQAIEVVHDFYTYTGGAHGMPGKTTHLFDRESGKEIRLESLIAISQEELESEVRARFLALVEETPEGFFEDAAETLEAKTDFDENFYFTEEGVVFYTQPYEIAPYAAGFTEVTFSYEELGIR